MPTPSRRWFRFGLRTMFVVLTVAAIAFWMNRSLTPQPWQEDPDHIRFLTAAKQLKRGSTPQSSVDLFRWISSAVLFTATRDAQGRHVLLTKYRQANGVYCIYWVTAPSKGGLDVETRCTSVKVFRLPPVPPGYQSMTANGRRRLSGNSIQLHSNNVSLFAYVEDLLAMVTGHHRGAPVFDYDLIYSDPLAPNITSSP